MRGNWMDVRSPFIPRNGVPLCSTVNWTPPPHNTSRNKTSSDTRNKGPTTTRTCFLKTWSFSFRFGIQLFEYSRSKALKMHFGLDSMCLHFSTFFTSLLPVMASWSIAMMAVLQLFRCLALVGKWRPIAKVEPLLAFFPVALSWILAWIIHVPLAWVHSSFILTETIHSTSTARNIHGILLLFDCR